MNNQLLLIIILIVIIFFIYNSTNKSVKQQFRSRSNIINPPYSDLLYLDNSDAFVLGANGNVVHTFGGDYTEPDNIDAFVGDDLGTHTNDNMGRFLSRDNTEPFVGTGAFGCANLARRCVNAYDPVDASTAFANFYNIIDVDVDTGADVNMTRDQHIDTFTGNKPISNLSMSYFPGNDLHIEPVNMDSIRVDANAAVGVDAIKRAVRPYASIDFLDMGAVQSYASTDPVNIGSWNTSN